MFLHEQFPISDLIIIKTADGLNFNDQLSIQQRQIL